MKTLAGIVAFALFTVVALADTNAFAQYPPPPPPPSSAYPAPMGYGPTGYAPPRSLFGTRGVLDISAATTARFFFASTSHPSSSSTSDVGFDLTPSAQYFVIDGLSVGGTIQFDWNKPKDSDALTTFGIGPTVGYNLWLTPSSLSLWPQATIAFQSTSLSFTSAAATPGTGTGTTTTTTSVTETKFTVGIFVPLLIHPVDHFHFGVGPFFSTDISSKASSGSVSGDGDKVTTVGIKFEIGGWLGPF